MDCRDGSLAMHYLVTPADSTLVKRQPDTMPRMTILCHEVGPSFVRQPVHDGEPHAKSERIACGPEHWDWLFEPESHPDDSPPLMTWATDPIDPTELLAPIDLVQPAIRLAPHRLRYLDFQGDIGQQRGHVRQIATGDCEFLHNTGDLLECRLRVEKSSLLLTDRVMKLTLSRSVETWILRVWDS